ncbi:MAG TPA: glycosyltransferase [Xanthomonadales bacterium]|nr:glycosyltransferase [Xanthomonadales bacterium]
MNILHTTPTYWPAIRYGGPIESVHRLAVAQRKLGHDVHAVATSVDGDGDLDVAIEQAVDVDGVDVRYARSAFLRRTYWSPGLARQVSALLPRADVLHLHSVFLWPTSKAASLARRAGVPYVVSPRGMLVPELIAERGAWRKRAWLALFEKRTLRGAAAIHVTSERERADLGRVGIEGLPRVVVVPNGVELPDGSEDRPRDPESIVFLGRLSWKKRIDWAIRALASCPLAELTIAGPDSEGLRASLDAVARECGVADRVGFLGQVDAAKREALLEHASLLVLPSVSENFGNVVVEALAHGCPVVVTPGVGAAEVVRDSGGGWVCDDDPAAFAQAVSRAMEYPSQARERGERGREHVEHSLTWPAVAARMVDLYRSLPGVAERAAARMAAPT